MCHSEFTKLMLEVCGEERRMILCKEQDFKNLSERKRQSLFRNAFPGLSQGVCFLKRKIKYRAVNCFKLYSSQFDEMITHLQRQNDWDETRFVALWLFEDDGKNYCGAKPVVVN